MPSTYSTSMRFELIATGEKSGTWGGTTNTNVGTLLEQAIGGYQQVAMTDANYTLTTANGAPDEARNMVLRITGTLSAQRNVSCPSGIEKLYLVENATTGGQSIVFKTVSGTGVTIPNGATSLIYVNGTNAVEFIQSPVSVALGGTGATSAANARTNLGLGTAAVQNTGTSGANVPLLNGTNTWSSSQTFSASLNRFGSGSGQAYAAVNGGAGFSREFVYQTNGTWRWSTGATATAEAGSNLGSDFAVARFDDAGNYIDIPLQITRSSGVTTIKELAITTPLAIAQGGTGATSAANARTNLGLGTAAVQNTGTSGATVPLLNGSNTWSTSQTFSAINTFGSGAIGVDIVLNGAAGTGRQITYRTNGLNRWIMLARSGPETGANAGSNFAITSYDDAGNYIEDPLVLTRATGAISIKSLFLTNDLAVTEGGTGASDAATARTNLGLGSISTQAANSVAITGGTVSGITDLAVADGGTGASDAAGARTNLGLGALAVLSTVGASEITDGAVGTAELANAAVTTAKIADANVTTAKIADANVTTAKILDANVTTAKIADASITPAKLNGAQSGSAPIYGARAWVNFNGSGTVSIRAGGNVTSVTDVGVGRYTVNLTTAMQDANYAAVVTAGDTTVSSAYLDATVKGTPTTTAIPITISIQNSGNPSYTDVDYIFCAVLR